MTQASLSTDSRSTTLAPRLDLYIDGQWVQPEGGVTQWVGRDRVLYLTAHELHHLGRAELALWQFGQTDLPDFP